MNRRLAVLLAGAGLLGLHAPATGATESGIAEVRQAASEYARAQRGTVYFHVATSVALQAGPVNRRDASSAAYVLENGALAKKRYLFAVENKHHMSAPELEKKDAEPEGPLTRLGMLVPSRPNAVDDYTYDAPVSASGGMRIGFRARVRDAAHGDGTLELDASGRFARLAFTPAVLPEHAQMGSVMITFGDVAPGMWDIVRIDRTFAGRRFFIKGSVESVSRYAEYRRFPTVEAGISALMRATMPEHS